MGIHTEEALAKWKEAKANGVYLSEGKYDLRGDLLEGCAPVRSRFFPGWVVVVAQLLAVLVPLISVLLLLAHFNIL